MSKKLIILAFILFNLACFGLGFGAQNLFNARRDARTTKLAQRGSELIRGVDDQINGSRDSAQDISVGLKDASEGVEHLQNGADQAFEYADRLDDELGKIGDQLAGGIREIGSIENDLLRVVEIIDQAVSRAAEDQKAPLAGNSD